MGAANPPRILLSTLDAANRLGVSRRTVWRMVEQPDERDRLPHTRFGGQLKIPSDLLEEWMDRHTWDNPTPKEHT